MNHIKNSCSNKRSTSMKIKLVIILLLSGVTALAQKSPKYIVLNIPKTIIKVPPQFLNVKDTINKNRQIGPVSNVLGGLKPAYPMAISTEVITGNVLAYMNCLEKHSIFSGSCTNYLIEKGDTIIEINSKEKFIGLFAPVEDKEEALSFAFALCDNLHMKAIYDFNFLNEKGTDYEIYRKELKPTSVKEIPGGYEVILFSTYYGFTAYCSEVIIFVSRQGELKVLKSESLFHDKEFGLIIN